MKGVGLCEVSWHGCVLRACHGVGLLQQPAAEHCITNAYNVLHGTWLIAAVHHHRRLLCTR
jgi:hypothetical protein